MDELNPSVARLCRAFLADETQDQTLTLLWAALASELIGQMAADQAAMLEARLDALARAAEELPPGVSINQILELATAMRRITN